MNILRNTVTVTEYNVTGQCP